MLVRDVMEPPVCIGPTETLRAAALKMKNQNTGCLVVCGDRHVMGILTDRDLVIRGIAGRRDLDHTMLHEVMSAQVHCCLETDALEHAAEMMESNRMHRLPVLDSEQEVVGVISRNNIDHGASDRAPFEVIFYKTITDSSGHPHHGELRRITISPGHTRDEAVAAAIKIIEADKGASWTQFADGYDVVEVKPELDGKFVERVVDGEQKH